MAEFVENWLLIEEQWGPGRFTHVEVVFADEEPQPSALRYWLARASDQARPSPKRRNAAVGYAKLCAVARRAIPSTAQHFRRRTRSM